MVNDFGLDAELAATNPVQELPAASVLPTELNDAILQQITESRRRSIPVRGVMVARVGFLGVLVSVGFLLAGLYLQTRGDVAEVSPAIRATPVAPPRTTAEVLSVGPDTTLAGPLSSLETTTTTAPPETTTTTARNGASDLPEVGAPVPDAPADPIENSGDNNADDPAAGDNDDTGNDDTGDGEGTSGDDDDAAGNDEADGDGADGDGDGSTDDRVCTAVGDTKKAAVAAYQQACSLPQVDCDPIEDYWMCSSEQIGDGRPGNP